MKQLTELNLNDKKYIIFDMDGTIVDTIGMWNKVDYLIIKQLSNKEVDISDIQKDKNEFFIQNTEGNIYLKYCEFLLSKYNLNSTKEEIQHLNKIISNDLIKNEIEYKPLVDKLIKYLKELGFTLVLATVGNINQINIYSKINPNTSSKLNLYEYFDLILTKEDVEKKKPDPEIYLKVLEMLDANPEECLVIEDSLHGILAAKGANIETVNIYDKYSDSERYDINNLTDYKIDNYECFLDYLTIILKNQNKTNTKKKQLIQKITNSIIFKNKT